MSPETFLAVATLGSLAFTFLIGCWLGHMVGAARQRRQWAGRMEKCRRYQAAVDDLDKWCGHGSPHARLIARHLKAEGEGLEMNAGTPYADEACTISGLREQLRRLEAHDLRSNGATR